MWILAAPAWGISAPEEEEEEQGEDEEGVEDPTGCHRANPIQIILSLLDGETLTRRNHTSALRGLSKQTGITAEGSTKTKFERKRKHEKVGSKKKS
mmetsp:Transcript_5500/g.9016  ORF Transcript_5500/g.9016 Transcript_5500/m.9016 type:complete len:96 (-) Transcript_5500:166-453(-)